MIFTRQFATMIDAGLPLVQCLDILATQTENKRFAKVLDERQEHRRAGRDLLRRARKHPKVFDELYVNLVAAGEVGGILDTILNRLAIYIEKAVKLKRQVKSAMVYPIAVLVVAIGVIAVMLIKVIPVFENMFKDFGGRKLPGADPVRHRHLATASSTNWYIYRRRRRRRCRRLHVMLRRTERGKRDLRSHASCKVPVIGPVLRKIAVARFTRTLGTLLSSGVPILDALDICAKTSGNSVVEERHPARAREDLRGQGHGRPARRDRASSRRWSCR